MTQPATYRGRGPQPDPIAVSVDQAIRAGWVLTPTISLGNPVPALVRVVKGYPRDTTDVVTLPLDGPCEVYRIVGGPSPDHPRDPGDENFRHIVPLLLALRWVLFNAPDDELFVEWTAANYSIPDEQHAGPNTNQGGLS